MTTHKTGWRWWKSTSGCVGSGALLVLLPKCPMCIAAYLTLWTGAGVAMTVATHLRPMMAILLLASALLLAFRWVVRRMAVKSDAPTFCRIDGRTPFSHR